MFGVFRELSILLDPQGQLQRERETEDKRETPWNEANSLRCPLRHLSVHNKKPETEELVQGELLGVRETATL